ncbi:MAG: hypothetical protein ACJAZI_000722 [Cycloclasticus sp.]|jgi:hypothetical protein|tara:strand:- start:1068 stop:1637 length:570 start_codon:yes stop_codon:yes gene_type:complete
MHILRHYFISDSLDDLEVFEQQLESHGVSTPQIHVLSMHDEEVAQHEHLNYVQSFMKKDVVRSSEIGLLIGLTLAIFLLSIAHFAAWTETAAGWVPFIFLSAILIGFCTWEGGLLGIQKPNYQFERFAEALKNDKHIFFVDLEPGQEEVLEKVLKSHPQVELAGTGAGTPRWLLVFQNKVPRFFRETFP